MKPIIQKGIFLGSANYKMCMGVGTGAVSAAIFFPNYNIRLGIRRKVTIFQ